MYLDLRIVLNQPVSTLLRDFENHLSDKLAALLRSGFGLYNRLRPSAVVIQNGLGLPLYQRLCQAVAESSWTQAENLLNQSSPRTRAFLIDCLSRESFRPAHYKPWIKAQPNNALAYILYSRALIHLAQQTDATRDSAATSQHVENTWQLLRGAENALFHAAQLAPNDPEPHYGLILSGQELQAGEERLWHRFSQLVKRDAHHYFGHLAMLRTLSPRQGGDADAMFEFVSATTRNLPAGGHPLYGLVPAAHIEQWLFLGTERADDDHPHAKADYFFNPKVWEPIVAAFHRTLPRQPLRGEPLSFVVLNTFAFCFYQAELKDHARVALEWIGANVTEHPWTYCESRLLQRYFDASHHYNRVLRQIMGKEFQLALD